MSHAVLTREREDAAEALEVLCRQHAALRDGLAGRVRTLLDAAAEHRPDDVAAARTELVGWCRAALLPRATAEEEVLYPAARTLHETRAVVLVLIDQHRELAELIEQVAGSQDALHAAASAAALEAVFDRHTVAEEEVLLPLLATAPAAQLPAVLDRMDAMLEDVVTATEVEVDARAVPHVIRSVTVLGALEALPPGGTLVLTAAQDPLPLLAQLDQRAPSTFVVRYLERGPTTWRLRFLRRGT